MFYYFILIEHNVLNVSRTADVFSPLFFWALITLSHCIPTSTYYWSILVNYSSSNYLLNPMKWLYSVIKRCCCFCFHHRFKPAELAFLTEYAAAMSPVAQATNILQAEANTQMGWLLPTINLLTIRIDWVKFPLKYCKPLVGALQVGIKNRFGRISGDCELITAVILLPKFWTSWTKEWRLRIG